MKKAIIIVSILCIALCGFGVYGLWYKASEKDIIFSISQASSPADISEQWPFDAYWKQSFVACCTIKRLNSIAPGKYKITSDMTPIDAVHMLRRKEQIDIFIRIDEVNHADSLFVLLSNEIGHLPSDYQQAFDSVFQNQNTVDPSHQRTTYFFADTYAFNFGESPKKIADRFHTFYNSFWNEEREKKRKEIGLTREQVYILASMVKGETKVFSEAITIAGLYMNRLNKPMKLQCDATVKYAMELKSVQRILKDDLQLTSPFNTYLIDGLPPGPIFITEKKYLDAVLQFEKHNYIYMCAQDDGSGKHLFTSSFSEHQENAKKYQRYLNGLNIKR